ncbi:MAG: hypothetical protein HUU38_27575, partial [Anaerolineales bacterium]|nr:hypothetical protein [Anaerolineales bacterium]
ARAAWPAFPFTPATAPFIAEICQQLDGIPLAIELAAVRVNALSIEKIAERLTYRFNLLTRHPHTTLPQHQTLSALVDWSYDLLDENERTLFQRLSIFSGSWTLEAAEAICASTPDDVPYTHPLHPMDILPILTRLIDKSLVQVPEINGENTRYRYLETIRQYARQKLRASGDEPQAFNNHAHYYLRLVSEANPLLKSSEQVQWTARLYAEQDNLRSAQNWWFQTNPTNALKMAGLMGRYWDRQGLYTEGRETLEKALSTSQNAPLPDRIKALKWASGLAMRQANYEKGKTLAREGLELTRSQDDKVNMAAFLNILGLITSGEGNDQEAQKFIAESVALQRQLENLWGIASGLDNLSNITRALGDAPHALTYMLECLEITRKLGDKFLIANNLVGAAEIYLDLNELTTAQQHLKDAIHLQQELNDQQGMAYALGELGVIAWLQKNYATAQNFLENSLKIRQNIGDKHGEGYILYLMSLNALACEDFLLAKGYLKTGLEILWPLGEQRITLNCLEALGHVAAGIGDTTRAIKLWAATHTLREQANLQNRAIFRTFHATKLEQTRHTPGGPAFTPHWQAGISMSIEALRALANDFFAHP